MDASFARKHQQYIGRHWIRTQDLSQCRRISCRQTCFVLGDRIDMNSVFYDRQLIYFFEPSVWDFFARGIYHFLFNAHHIYRLLKRNQSSGTTKANEHLQKGEHNEFQ